MKNDTFWRWFWVLFALNVAFFWLRSAEACTAERYAEVVYGEKRICYYRHRGETVTFDTAPYRLCPLTIEVEHE